jgi:hypothetical protein
LDGGSQTGAARVSRQSIAGKQKLSYACPMNNPAHPHSLSQSAAPAIRKPHGEKRTKISVAIYPL